MFGGIAIGMFSTSARLSAPTGSAASYKLQYCVDPVAFFEAPDEHSPQGARRQLAGYGQRAEDRGPGSGGGRRGNMRLLVAGLMLVV